MSTHVLSDDLEEDLNQSAAEAGRCRRSEGACALGPLLPSPGRENLLEQGDASHGRFFSGLWMRLMGCN